METRLKEKREAAKMTQEQLSKKAGISRLTIVNIENGKQETVLASTLIKLANALDCAVEELFA